MKVIIIKRTPSGKFRAFGMFGEYGSVLPARVWVGLTEGNSPIFEDTVLTLRDARGNTEQVMAGEPGLQFS